MKTEAIPQKASTRDRLRRLFLEQGASLYGGECITQLAHALQCAQLAEQAGESDAMILAALTHDVGHFFEVDFDEALANTRDARHERSAARYLSRDFGPEVTEPIRLHVDAKRYLCAMRAEYRAGLSPASIHSLALQGGPMNAAEVESFEKHPFYRHAVRLRLYDDQAKVPDRMTPDLEHFLARIP